MAIEIPGATSASLTSSKVDGTKTTPNSISGSNNQSSGQATDIENRAAASPVDKITLTKRAEELRMIEKIITEQTDVDNERLESLKLEIDSGQYDIDAQRVAQKLIEFEMLFVA